MNDYNRKTRLHSGLMGEIVRMDADEDDDAFLAGEIEFTTLRGEPFDKECLTGTTVCPSAWQDINFGWNAAATCVSAC